MHERRYQSDISGLRDPERVSRLGLDKISVLTMIDTTPKMTLLDIGTGTGLFAEYFVNLGFHVTGLDANPEMVKTAAHYLPSSKFHIGIAEKLPYPNNSFNHVFMGFLLHETDDHLAAMKEAYRVVRDNLMVLEWPDIDQANGPPQHHRLSHDQIISLGDQAGFLSFDKYLLNSSVLYKFKK